MELIRLLTLLFSLVFSGYLAGLFLTYAFIVMPGLATIDDRSFVAAFQGLERLFAPPNFEHGRNWPVLLSFPGLPIAVVASLLLQWGSSMTWWLLPALMLTVVTHATTFAVHLPLNNALSAAGDAATIDVAQVRADFQEERWRSWNMIRAAAATSAFACVLAALLLHIAHYW